MHQFLPELDRPGAIEHRKTGGDAARDGAGSINRHNVLLERGFRRRQSNRQNRNQRQHQPQAGMAKIGRGLRVIAKAPDGVIRRRGRSDPAAVGRRAMAPRRLHEEPEHLALFRMLVERASKST
jgi:hypothetical protein